MVAIAFVGVPGVRFVVEDVEVAGVVTVLGVPGVPRANAAVWVWAANCWIIAMGFSTDGSGETNNPVGIKVGVVAGA